jgi:hypothetical protein
MKSGRKTEIEAQILQRVARKKNHYAIMERDLGFCRPN